jgi:hypothetical protein
MAMHKNKNSQQQHSIILHNIQPNLKQPTLNLILISFEPTDAGKEIREYGCWEQSH